MDKNKQPELKHDGTDEPTKHQTAENAERHGRARRRLLHSMALGGAAVTVKTLPERWTTPILNAAILPGHAQSSPEPEVCDLACEIAEVRRSNSSGGDTPDVNGIPAMGGGSIIIQQIGDQTAFVFNQITATLNNECSAENVNLAVSLTQNVGGANVDIDQGMNQNVPVVGGVATFNEVRVGIPSVGSDSTGPFTDGISGDMSFVFTANNADNCVINANFDESAQAGG